MSFHPITVSAKTWNEVGPGKYMDSTITFGSPTNYFQISPGSYSSRSKTTNASISRVMQKDVTIGANVLRRRALAQLIIQTEEGFTTTELDAMVLSISDFCSVTTLERILQGER